MVFTEKEQDSSLALRGWQKKLLEASPQLRYLFLELTRQCNLRCRHCGSLCPSHGDLKLVDTERLKALIDEVVRSFSPDRLMFCVTGGEPLLRKDWFELCSYISEKGFLWGMTTNGTLIDDRCAERLEEAGMASVGVSLDGLREAHEALRGVPGCFDRAVAGIKALVKNGSFRAVQVITVVNTLNISQLEEFYRFIQALGVDSWKIAAIEPIGEARKNPELLLNRGQFMQMLEFIREKRELGALEVTFCCSHFLPGPYDAAVRRDHFLCGAGTMIASVASNGDILACLDIDDRERTAQGNIYRDDFVQVWNNGFADFRKNKGVLDSTCRRCEHLDFCRGGSWHTWDVKTNTQSVCFCNDTKGGQCNEFF